MKKIKNAFTLIELLVVIAIIGIIVTGVTQIDFNRLNDEQKNEIFSNKILTDYEQVRNNSLLGKGIGTDSYIPKKWKIEISNLGSGSIISSYLSGTTNWIKYNKIDFDDFFEISEIKCSNLKDNINLSLSGTTIGTGIIEISGNNISLTGACNNPKLKKITTSIKYKSYYISDIEINTINGIGRIIN